MAGTIWLIVEGQNDADIVRAVLKNKYPQVRIHPLHPTGKNPSLGQLAKEIKRLIKQALDRRLAGDCIAVLHDADLLSRPHGRADYDEIRKVCNS